MRRPRRPNLRRLMLPVAAAGTLLATGCSAEIGWPDGNADSASRASKSSFVKEGNAILCDKSERITRAVVAQVLSGREPTPAQEGGLALPPLRTAYRDLDRPHGPAVGARRGRAPHGRVPRSAGRRRRPPGAAGRRRRPVRRRRPFPGRLRPGRLRLIAGVSAAGIPGRARPGRRRGGTGRARRRGRRAAAAG